MGLDELECVKIQISSTNYDFSRAAQYSESRNILGCLVMWYSSQNRRKLCLKAFDLNFVRLLASADLDTPGPVTQTHLPESQIIVKPHIPEQPLSSNDNIEEGRSDTQDYKELPHVQDPANMSNDTSKTNGVPLNENPTNQTVTLNKDSITQQSQHSASNGTANTGQNESSSKKASKKDRPKSQTSNTEQDIAEAGAGVKLTGAQLKKQKAEEKAARRAQKVADKGAQALEQEQQAESSRAGAQRAPSTKKDSSTPQTPTAPHHKRKGSNQPEPGVIRVPFRPGLQTPSTPLTPQAPQQTKQVEKRVPMVAHLYSSAKPASLTSASREIHPAVLTLAMHLRSLTLAGSTARTLALLLTLKSVIRAYTTPANTALSRHLTTHLSHQISFLSAARPLGIAQGNAIRWLKKLISQLDPDLDELDAKKYLYEAIDGFILERVSYASQRIAEDACERIKATGETILVYGKSSVVEKTLLRAAREEGKKFRVIVVDSRPLFEGENLAKSLLRAGMREGGELEGCEVVYTLLSGISDVLEQNAVTKCFLGASGMLGNGGLYSRCGTAMVAMMAKQNNVPVIVLGESIKFTAKMVVDSLSLNEIGDPDALIEREDEKVFTAASVPKPEENAKKGGKKKEDEQEEDEAVDKPLLDGWKEQPNLYLLNLMYDVTPKDYLDMIICELGTLPPGGVPVVNGVHEGEE